MPKIKTHKASAKRFDVTGSGKIKMHSGGHRHNLGQKTRKMKRGLRQVKVMSESFGRTYRKLIQK